MATESTITLNPSGYLSNYSAKSVSNLENGYTDATSTSYASIDILTSKGSTSSLYYTFDTSSIPSNAVIMNVSCQVTTYIDSTKYLQKYQIQLCNEEEAIITKSIPTTKVTVSIDCGTISRDKLNDFRLRFYVQRISSSNHRSTDACIKFYGADLVVDYVVPVTTTTVTPVVGNSIIKGSSKTFSNAKITVDGVTKNIIESYCLKDGVWEPTWTSSSSTENVTKHIWSKYAVETTTTKVWSDTYYLFSRSTYNYHKDSSSCDYGFCRTYDPFSDGWSTYSFYTNYSYDNTTGIITFENSISLENATLENIYNYLINNDRSYLYFVDESGYSGSYTVTKTSNSCVITPDISLLKENEDHELFYSDAQYPENYFGDVSLTTCQGDSNIQTLHLAGYYWSENYTNNYSYSQGSTYYYDVASLSRNTYVDNGRQYDYDLSSYYWYVYQGSETV